MPRVALFVLLALVSALAAEAQTPAGAPPLVNGRLETRSGGDLAAAIRSAPSGATDVTWVGYSVAAAGRGQRCCWNKADDTGACCWGCRLERDGAVRLSAAEAMATPAPPVRLEPADTVAVLIRVAGGRVDRVRTFSPSCGLDGGGRTVVWLPSVAADASASWLHGQVSADNRRLTDDVLMALAAHASPRALDYLLAEARTGATTHLRGQALFWLAQRAGDRAIGAISDAIDKDPDTEVKRKAVFALSQLPDAEGVPRLIEVARAHSNAAVRKQAFFWLGQSRDPRALAFFADVLKR